jgi:hypothetical protein
MDSILLRKYFDSPMLLRDILGALWEISGAYIVNMNNFLEIAIDLNN